MPLNFDNVRYSGGTNKVDIDEFLGDMADSVENYVTNVSLGDGVDINWSVIDDKPTAFPPTTHQHTVADVTDLSATVAAMSVNLVPDPDNAGLYLIQ